MIIEDQKFTPYKDGLAVIPHKEETTSVSADEMFEKLEYKKFDNHPEEDEEIEENKWVTQDCRVIEYTQSKTIKGIFYTLFIRFHIVGKVIEIGATERREGYREMGRYRNPIINMQELQAINEKIKELGWI